MLNLDYILQVLPTISDALFLTIKISIIGVLLSILIGLICSIILFYKFPYIKIFINIYISFFRSTPLLLHLFFIYYGLPRLLNIVLSFETVALLGLSLLGGSYMAESFRSGIEAVGNNQLESATALGLSRYQIFRYIVLPQAISYSIPTLGANCIFLFKETSVFTCIAGSDITTVAIGLISMDYKTTEALFLLVISYFIVLFPFILFLSFLEKKVRYAEFGN